VRIDFISTRLTKRTNAIIDLLGLVVFTIPLSVIMINLGWPVFYNAFVSGEMSQNAGGLIRWPVILLVPLGFGLLIMQSLSEVIKRIAFLKGDLAEPFTVENERSVEEQLADELAIEAEARLSVKPAGSR
jgi:TRAP-type mannitol/chloroaromatic compound transport system permease small subunit